MSNDGILVDIDKVMVIMKWSVAKNVSGIRSFMGITRYYRKFIEVFSKIVYPITSLQKKGKMFKWSKTCIESFNKLKHLLTTALILKIVDPLKDFVICTDACNEGLGGVLLQDNYVVAYESIKLKDHEKS